MAQYEFAVFLLSTWKISDRRLQIIGPVTVMQILGADEMPASEKARDQSNLLPSFSIFAPDCFGTNKKGHLGLSICGVSSRRSFASSKRDESSVQSSAVETGPYEEGRSIAEEANGG